MPPKPKQFVERTVNVQASLCMPIGTASTHLALLVSLVSAFRLSGRIGESPWTRLPATLDYMLPIEISTELRSYFSRAVPISQEECGRCAQ